MYDVIIVGGGPAGLTSAIYLLRACKRVLVIEKEVFGGQITKSSEVENYPGYSHISGLELGTSFYEQAKSLGMESIYGTVSKIEKEQEIFKVTVDEKTYEAKSVIYATGSSPRMLGIEKEKEYIGSGVSYCATCDGAFFRGKDVAVVGGGNTAIQDAIYLSNICHKVYLIHRRDEFRAEASLLETLKSKENVEMICFAVVKDIIGNNKVEQLVLQVKEEERRIEVSGVFVAIGSIPNTDILNGFVDLNQNGYIKTNSNLETNIPGFYAAGDVREKEVRQLTTATSDGTICAIQVGNYLDQK